MRKQSVFFLAVLIFLLGIVGATWGDGLCQDAKLLALDGAFGDLFGRTVAIWGDTAIIGADGSAYVFRFDSANWLQEAKLLPFDGAGGYGWRVAIEGDRALVGAIGSVYIFRFDGTNWLEEAKLLPFDKDNLSFGLSIAISGDTVVVGAQMDSDNGREAGAAYVFRHYGSSWVGEQKLLACDGAEDDWFGSSVAVFGDTALIGAKFDNDNGRNSGSVYAFHRDHNDTPADASDDFWVEEAKLLASDRSERDFFGWSVSLHGDLAVIGAEGDDDNGNGSGSAYVFHFDGSSWVEEAKLLASDGAAWEYFGESVALWGNTAVIGAHGDYDNGVSSGSAYVFAYDGSNWVQKVKLYACYGGGDDRFGRSVSLWGDTALVGAERDEDNGFMSGAAYVFTLKPPAIEAEIDINPNTLNLKSKGKWISCDIRLGEEYNVADVNSYSVFLEDEIEAEWIWAYEQEQVLMAKFSRSALQEMLAVLETPTQVELLVTGELADGTIFEGTDTIKVIDKGNKK